MSKLGSNMTVAAFTVKGNVHRLAAQRVVESVVKTLKMNKAHEPVWYHYPVNNCGGTGFTLIQPITESFIAFDAWPDFKGAYVVICSCKPVDIDKVMGLFKKLNYKVKQSKANYLNLEE